MAEMKKLELNETNLAARYYKFFCYANIPWRIIVDSNINLIEYINQLY